MCADTSSRNCLKTCKPILEQCISRAGVHDNNCPSYGVACSAAVNVFAENNLQGTACDLKKGEGDCDSDNDCSDTLQCIHDVGDFYDMDWTTDVCLQDDSVNRCARPDNPETNKCTQACTKDGDCKQKGEKCLKACAGRGRCRADGQKPCWTCDKDGHPDDPSKKCWCDHDDSIARPTAATTKRPTAAPTAPTTAPPTFEYEADSLHIRSLRLVFVANQTCFIHICHSC